MGTLYKPQLAFALDVPNLDAATRWIDALSSQVDVFKVGLELFVSEGPCVIDAVQKSGKALFLDLKLHDIEETVARTTERIVSLGVDYATLHAASGSHTLARAQSVAGNKTKLLAVTVLTNLTPVDLQAIGFAKSPIELAKHLASMAQKAGVPGLVCSAQECAALRNVMGHEAILVTPGIRLSDQAQTHDDQARASTPEAALAAGSNMLVVGRPIKNATEPVKVAASLHQLIESLFP